MNPDAPRATAPKPTAPQRAAPKPAATASSLTVWQAAKEAIVPVVAYWACVLFAFAAFSAAVALSNGAGAEDIVILASLAFATFVGVAIGQALAFLRVRTWIVLSFGAICWIASIGFGVALSSMIGEAGAIVALVLFLLPIALSGGLWSLETHRALWATWLPLLYATSSVIIWSEARGTDAAWFAGDKWAIWDIVTVAVLGAVVLLVLVFLVARETHRLALWRRGPTAPLAPTLREQGAARPRLTLLSAVLLFGLAGALTVATAVVSPYLWRTGPGDRDGDGGDGQEQSQGQGDGQEEAPDEGENETMQKIGRAMKELAEQAVEAGQKAGGAVCSMLTLVLLAFLGTLVAWRPLKRLFLLRHLKDPFWSVPATTRIEQGWRLVEIALGDAGVHPRPGEDAAGLARRARPVLAKLSPVEVHGLEDAAEVADRVRFGLGVGPEDLEVMGRFSAWAIDTVWERLGDREQVRCMYRAL
jgi:hypothetical protein